MVHGIILIPQAASQNGNTCVSVVLSQSLTMACPHGNFLPASLCAGLLSGTLSFAIERMIHLEQDNRETIARRSTWRYAPDGQQNSAKNMQKDFANGLTSPFNISCPDVDGTIDCGKADVSREPQLTRTKRTKPCLSWDGRVWEGFLAGSLRPPDSHVHGHLPH